MFQFFIFWSSLPICLSALCFFPFVSLVSSLTWGMLVLDMIWFNLDVIWRKCTLTRKKQVEKYFLLNAKLMSNHWYVALKLSMSITQIHTKTWSWFIKYTQTHILEKVYKNYNYPRTFKINSNYKISKSPKETDFAI